MNKKIRGCCSWLMLPMLLSASACQPKTTATAAVATANVIPPAPETATAPFQGAIPVDLPGQRADQGGDVNSFPNAALKMVTSGEAFVRGRFERPFNANTMDTYFPYLDIVDFQGFVDDTWGYATITLEDADTNAKLPGQYAIELDLNRDGRGDWLIRATHPASTQWSTDGVQAWNDVDGDVGGDTVMAADSKPASGDSYEALVFDQGKGNLIDGAWARIKPDDPKAVEIAFKLSMVGSPTSFAMGAWAGTDIDPAMFDYNDHLTHAQAGSPLSDLTVYPLKALAEIDNTCRLAIGFNPTGKEPGLCSTAQQLEKEGPGRAPGPPPCTNPQLCR